MKFVYFRCNFQPH